MPRKVEIIAHLISESRELEELGRRIQGERELIASEDEIKDLVERCQEWFWPCSGSVPEEFCDRLRAEFNGSWHSNKIKHFLEAPGVSLLARDNGRTKRGDFNPDFFILLDSADEVVVVETKMDDDVSDQNIGKLAAAKAHFQKLNELLADDGSARRYGFHFLSPVDYDKFFAALRKGKHTTFTSTLQAQLTP